MTDPLTPEARARLEEDVKRLSQDGSSLGCYMSKDLIALLAAYDARGDELASAKEYIEGVETQLRAANEACDARGARIEELEAELNNATAALKKAERAFLADALPKSIVGDDTIYHLDGQSVGSALEAVRYALMRQAALSPTPDAS